MKNRSIFKRNRPGYEIRNKSEKEPTEIFLYDEIGFWGVTAEAFAKDLKAIKNAVTIRINSPGGSVFDGVAMYKAISDFKNPTTTIIDGLAASAASYVALAGDTVQMSEGAFMMIHDPYSMVVGTSGDMRKEADLLDKIRDEIAGFYVRKSEKSIDEIVAMMAEETWLNGEDAVEFGLVDEVLKKDPVKNSFDLTIYNNVPDVLTSSEDCGMQKPKVLENALRDAGLSRREAKTVLSNGLKALTLNQPEDDDIWAGLTKLHLSVKG